MSFTILLPYPPAELLPNKPIHYMKRGALKKKLRAECNYVSTINPTFKKMAAGKDCIPLKIVFVMPHAKCDLDNLLASFKAGIDGMADALGVNDRRFRPIIVNDRLKSKEAKAGRVEVTIYEPGEVPEWLK